MYSQYDDITFIPHSHFCNTVIHVGYRQAVASNTIVYELMHELIISYTTVTPCMIKPLCDNR